MQRLRLSNLLGPTTHLHLLRSLVSNKHTAFDLHVKVVSNTQPNISSRHCQCARLSVLAVLTAHQFHSCSEARPQSMRLFAIWLLFARHFCNIFSFFFSSLIRLTAFSHYYIRITDIRTFFSASAFAPRLRSIFAFSSAHPATESKGVPGTLDFKYYGVTDEGVHQRKGELRKHRFGIDDPIYFGLPGIGSFPLAFTRTFLMDTVG